MQSGWLIVFKRSALVVLCGVMVALTQPFPSLFDASKAIQFEAQGYLSLVALIPFLLVLSDLRPVAALVYGFALFFIADTLIFIWLFIAISGAGLVSLWASAFFMSVAAASMAVCGAFAVFLCAWMRENVKLPQWIGFPIALCAAEWIRGTIPWGGFPNGNFGHSLVVIPTIAQGASAVGMYGMVFFGALINSSLAELIKCRFALRTLPVFATMLLALLSVGVYGSLKLNEQPSPSTRKLSIGIVQANISHEVKSHKESHEEFISSTLAVLQKDAVNQGADLVIWPETAFPRPMMRDQEVVANFPAFEVPTFVGAVTVESVPGQRNHLQYDSAVLVQGDSRVVDRFDKVHLVPLAEYLPWPVGAVLYGPLANPIAFSAGVSGRPLKLTLNDGTKFNVGTIVCYDAYFADVSRELVKNGADFLVQLSNDDWFGRSAGPVQNLNMFRLRAIETGRVFVRAANSGISGWIDPRGEVHDATDLNKKTLLMAQVPILKEDTLYVVIGDIVPKGCLLFIIALTVAWALRVSWQRRRVAAVV